VGYGVAEYADFQRIRREAREQDAAEGNAEAAGAELEAIADGTREIGAEALRLLVEVEDVNDRPALVDVRTPAEYAAGHMPGARTLPLHGLAAAAASLDPQRTVVVYASTMTGGIDASYVLKQAGFRDVRSLAGGWDAWLEARGPVVRGV
jgi:rhodanese-related sulfurtransferase